jgi:ABC-type maltose transport system permease subunit
MPDLPTAAYGLHVFIKGNIVHGSVQSPPIQLAAGVLLMLPILVIFLVFKDKIMNNISMGGLKG